MPIDEISRRRRRKPGDLAALRRTLWASLLEIEDLMRDPDANVKIRAAHALGTLAGSYLRAIELQDIAGRIETLEARADLTAPKPLRRPA